ncbi:MAG: hypothetical protein M3R10_04940 [Verrucomicrobiota bacterium]|nr:hypothetical protein [Verrucomicrobiota bacterium]
MEKFTEEDIATLLRLKRHEQPPPGYFDNFLHEFHRRQRAELLKQPLWKIALQRAQDFMFQLNVGSMPAAATALVILAAVISLKVYQTPNAATVAVVTPATSAVNVSSPEPAWSLSTPVTTRDLGATPFRMATGRTQLHGRATTPRYVLDATPVSYEASLRF